MDLLDTIRQGIQSLFGRRQSRPEPGETGGMAASEFEVESSRSRPDVRHGMSEVELPVPSDAQYGIPEPSPQVTMPEPDEWAGDQEPDSGDSMPEPDDRDETKKSDRLSTLDFMSMPSAARRILRLMLRKPEVSYPELCEMIDALPESKRISRAELDDALADLCERAWILQVEVDDVFVYQINLGAKTGSDVSRARPSPTTPKRDSLAMKDLWDAVDSTSDTDYRKRHGAQDSDDEET
jgi:hypothetical protein